MRAGAIAGAVLIGGVVGFVGNDAREQAVARSEVEVVLGAARFAETSSNAFALSVRNTGGRTVDIVDVTMAGFTQGTGDWAAVAAEPDTWTDLVMPLEPDCTTRPADEDRIEAELEVRTDDGTSTTLRRRLGTAATEFTKRLWKFGCDSASGMGLQVRGPTTSRIEPDRVDATVQITPDGDRRARILDVDSTIPGLAVSASELPRDAGADGSTTVTVSLSVRECGAAPAWDEAAIRMEIVPTNGDRARSVRLPLGSGTTLTEVVRLVERTCGRQERS
ncbi:hypothetical protein CLV30_104279 [Haloactinopolyspora alba]|uniref:Uncharacterized protein n=1 Tax=Haloactinopolyspora alba TaxID=648780 RepID=A0A2P8E7G7_9ACTN|nr:hypothetical protein CLV30_104279 [Haloactinopolyspora alba]